MTKQIYVTDKIKDDLDKLSSNKGIPVEGLTCVPLRLALIDECFIDRALKLIEKCDLKYESTELEKRGW